MTDDLLQLARECGARIENWMTNPPKPGLLYFTPDQLATFSQRIRESEREQCAVICEQVGREFAEHPEMARTCADAIRAGDGVGGGGS